MGNNNICFKVYFTIVNLLVHHIISKTVRGINVEPIAFSDGYQMNLTFNSVTGVMMTQTLTAIISTFVTQKR